MFRVGTSADQGWPVLKFSCRHCYGWATAVVTPRRRCGRPEQKQGTRSRGSVATGDGTLVVFQLRATAGGAAAALNPKLPKPYKPPKP